MSGMSDYIDNLVDQLADIHERVNNGTTESHDVAKEVARYNKIKDRLEAAMEMDGHFREEVLPLVVGDDEDEEVDDEPEETGDDEDEEEAE